MVQVQDSMGQVKTDAAGAYELSSSKTGERAVHILFPYHYFGLL